MKKEIIGILYNLRSVHNTASIFRTADGVGIKKLYLVGTTPSPIDRFGDKRNDFSKVSLGSEESVEYESVDDVLDLIEKLKKDGFKIVSVEQNKDSKSVYDFKVDNKIALILGAEVEGVPGDVLEKSDSIVEIPMRGKKESLNVAVSFGVVTYILTK